MKIPKTIRVGSRRYKVSLVDAIKPVGAMAEVSYADGTIKLCTHSSLNGRSFKTEELDDSFWHELTHAILHEMGRVRLRNDERFVTEFAHLLTKAINSAKF